MKSSGLVSVIVPIYKVEKYLHRCVDSILNQTYKDLEIILVDDGSPDNCPAICDEYAAKDSRVKVIHQENAGVSAARNVGLDIATGDYIAFVDSDDWIEKNTIEFCMNKLCDSSFNIVWFGTKIQPPQRGECVCEKLNENMTYDELIEYYAARGASSYIWDKLYRRCVWDELRFPNGLLFEDSYVSVDFLEQNKNKILTVSEIFYNYRRNDQHGSILDKVASNPMEPYYRWEWINKARIFLEKMNHSAYEDFLGKSIKYALKAYIVNLATHCLSCEQLIRINVFLTEQYLNCSVLSCEYRIYYYSWKHLNFVNRIKALDFRWKYRNWK